MSLADVLTDRDKVLLKVLAASGAVPSSKAEVNRRASWGTVRSIHRDAGMIIAYGDGYKGKFFASSLGGRRTLKLFMEELKERVGNEA